MTDEATTARQNAQHCEAIKYALRQSKDGVVVSFVLHPHELPSMVQLAPIGSRFVLAFVEIGEDDKPKEVSQTAPAPVSPVTARAHHHDKRLTMQAVMSCKDPIFWAFLAEHGMLRNRDKESAKTAVLLICHVKSRSEIIPGSPAAEEWNILYSKYIAWKLVAA